MIGINLTANFICGLSLGNYYTNAKRVLQALGFLKLFHSGRYKRTVRLEDKNTARKERKSHFMLLIENIRFWIGWQYLILVW